MATVPTNPQKALASHQGFALFLAVDLWGGKHDNFWLKGVGPCQGINGASNEEGAADRSGQVLEIAHHLYSMARIRQRVAVVV